MADLIRLVGNSSLTLWLVLLTQRTVAQGPPAPPPPAEVTARPPDYKIAYWYVRSDPLTSIRHRVYDVRKGQYTPAVDDWLRTMRANYPGYDAYVKELRLKPEGGESEKKQVATAVLQEYVAKGGPYEGFGLSDTRGLNGSLGLESPRSPGGVPAGIPPSSRPGVSLYTRGYGFANAPGANRPPAFLTPPSQSPFPYPFVRPHP